MHRQRKVNWSKFEDQCTRLFFDKVKQRKQASFIYSIHNKNNDRMDGFDAVAEAITEYYKQLLRKQSYRRQQVNFEILEKGSMLSIKS